MSSPSLLASLAARKLSEIEQNRRNRPKHWYERPVEEGGARENQKPPTWDWRTWALCAGRGFGKTRTGAEWVNWIATTGKARRIGLIGATAADVRDVMVEGESGILAIASDADRPAYRPSVRRLEWPNGAIATTYSADQPDRLRGPQHDALWADELCAWRYMDSTWDMAMFGLRLGQSPQVVVTTTPRPVPLFKALLKDRTTHVTTGSTYENIANLAPAFVDQIIKRYEGTRLGAQELDATILEDAEGALWKRDILDQNRVTKAPKLTKILIAIDPKAEATADSETGIVAVGLGVDRHGYLLDDNSINSTPEGWAKQSVAAYYRHQANAIVAEVNQGGDMVVHTIHTVEQSIPVRKVRATRGKYTRAEPVASLYEQGRIHHVGTFGTLEDQLCSWVPGEKSPDRLDALVWGFTELMVDSESNAATVSQIVSRETIVNLFG